MTFLIPTHSSFVFCGDGIWRPIITAPVLFALGSVLLLAVILNPIGVHLSQYGSSASDLVNGGFLVLVVVLQSFLARRREL